MNIVLFNLKLVAGCFVIANQTELGAEFDGSLILVMLKDSVMIYMT